MLLMLFLPFASCTAQDGHHTEGGIAKLPSVRPKMVRNKSNLYTNIHCSLKDKNGNLWFGTTTDGVYKYDGRGFTSFTTKDGLPGDCVWCMMEDKAGKIWIGTNTGLCYYKNGIIMPVSITPVSAGNFMPGISNNEMIAGNEVLALMQDRSGKIWIGTREDLIYYDGNTFYRFLDDHNLSNKGNLQLKMIDCMLEAKDGTLWFGSGSVPGSDGICRYDGKSITSFKPNADSWIRYLVADRKGNIWIGTRHEGVWRYDGNAFSVFSKRGDVGLAAMADSKGNIWFSGGENDDYTNEGYIWKYDGSHLDSIPARNMKYSVWSILEDNMGNLWFGTRNAGLFRFDGKNYTEF